MMQALPFRSFRSFLFCLALGSTWASPGWAAIENRMALVIGNSEYADGDALKNPVNDAKAIAAALEEQGFDDVQLVLDVDLRGLKTSLSEFTQKLGPKSLGLLFYAGHGLRVDGLNYMVPIGFEARNESDVRWEAFPADRAREMMEGSGAPVNLLVLDMCRNNPLGSTRSWTRALGNRGMSPMQEVRGTLVMFAAGPGETASDNPQGENGLFTEKLLVELKKPGQTVKGLFGNVRKEVFYASGKKQFPWLSDGLLEDFQLFGQTVAVAQPGIVLSAPPKTGHQAAQAELNVFCMQGDCNVQVDGKSVGSTKKGQVLKLSVAAGEFQLQISKDGYQSHQEQIAIFPGEEKRINVRLESAVAPQPTPKPKPVAQGPPAGTSKTIQLPGGASLEMVWIPGGEFTMGCSPGDKDCWDESPPHRVQVDGFWMGRYEVTMEQWNSVMPGDQRNAMYTCKGNCPAETISWEEAQSFVSAASHGLRLPTEAEWEFAARAGEPGILYGALDDIAWQKGNSGGSTHPVGQKQPNAYGLYDMLGNVAEWCQDDYQRHAYEGRTGVTDGTRPVVDPTAENKVMRGSTFNDEARENRLSARQRGPADLRMVIIGFRVVQSGN